MVWAMHTTIRELLDKLEIANETILQLRKDLTAARGDKGDFNFYPKIKLSRHERRLLNLLIDVDLCKRRTIVRIFSEVRDEKDAVIGNEEPINIRVTDVVKCRLNKKLRPFGVQVKTQWGIGMYLTVEDKEILKTLQ